MEDTSFASALRHKAAMARERINKQKEEEKKQEIKQGFDDLLKRLDALAEKGFFSHICRGSREACTNYMHSLQRMGFRVELESYQDPLGPSEINKIRIKWGEVD